MLLHSMYDYSMLDILASIPIWLYYIPFLLFAILLPCIWHLSFVHAGFSLCNALCHSSFYHYSYSVLPLFLLRHAIIASSLLTVHPEASGSFALFTPSPRVVSPLLPIRPGSIRPSRWVVSPFQVSPHLINTDMRLCVYSLRMGNRTTRPVENSARGQLGP